MIETTYYKKIIILLGFYYYLIIEITNLNIAILKETYKISFDTDY